MKLKTFRCKKCKNNYDAYKKHKTGLCPDCLIVSNENAS